MTFTLTSSPSDSSDSASAPNSARWSLANTTPCKLECYMRPCQTGDSASDPINTSHPLAEVCATDRELIYIVEDDDDFRELLVELVEATGFEAVSCKTADQLMATAIQAKSGCILLDIKLPGQDGLAIQDWLKKSDITLPVIFVSGVQDVSVAVHCMKAGAFEFLQKPFNELAFRRAVNQAVGLSRMRHCEQESRRMIRRLMGALTPTEMFVAKRIASGHLTKRIAAEMQRSENTVKIHRHRIFNKLMVHSAASIANIIRHVDMLSDNRQPDTSERLAP